MLEEHDKKVLPFLILPEQTMKFTFQMNVKGLEIAIDTHDYICLFISCYFCILAPEQFTYNVFKLKYYNFVSPHKIGGSGRLNPKIRLEHRTEEILHYMLY